jgi:hypothetical protein
MRNNIYKMVEGQLVDDTENWYAAQDRIYAQIDRLGDAIPYGLYWQIPTDKLEKMTIEDAREWTRNFHSTPGKRANSTNVEVAA